MEAAMLRFFGKIVLLRKMLRMLRGR